MRPDPRSPWMRLPVALEGPGFTGRGELELEEWGGGSVGFIAYFESLATDWRGWAGERVWEDDQGNIRLVATHDGIGYAFLEVSLYRLPGSHRDEEWSINAIIAMDAGQLGPAAAKLRALIANALEPI